MRDLLGTSCQWEGRGADVPAFYHQDPRIERIPCMHSGTYADDCICEKVKQHRCYIVATCDRDLRRRIRKVMLCPCADSDYVLTSLYRIHRTVSEPAGLIMKVAAPTRFCYVEKY